MVPEPIEPPAAPSRASLRGLDWFIFFVADVQTGFGPFLSVYLTAQKWTQVDIGLVQSVGSLVALAGQIPGGALVDLARSERLVAGIAIAAISVSALAYAAWPILPIVLSAAVRIPETDLTRLFCICFSSCSSQPSSSRVSDVIWLSS